MQLTSTFIQLEFQKMGDVIAFWDTNKTSLNHFGK